MHSIINEFTALMHRHGPNSSEVEAFLAQYDHNKPFVTRAKTLQSVFLEKDKVTEAQQ